MKKLVCLTAIYCTLVFTACSADAAKKQTATPAPATEDQKTLYAMGLFLSNQLDTFDLTAEELAMVQKGMADGASGAKTDIKLDEYGPKIQTLQQARMTAAGERNAKEGAAYVTKAATEAGVTKTESGIIIKHTKEGTGPSPTATDQVKVHYTGRLIDGKVFDSSVERGEPIVFPLNGVIACWTEGVQTMKVGGTAKLVCPSNLAYGESGRPPSIMPNSALIFDVELIEIVKPEAPPAAMPEPKKK